ISTFALATARQPLLALTIVRISVNGRPDLPSVTSRLKYAELLIIPILSGYGPSVSDGVTAQVDEDVVVVVEELGLVGAAVDSPQPIAMAMPARPPNASRT